LSVPLLLSAAQGFTIPAIPSAGNSRIDIIEVRPQYTATEASTIGVFNTATRVFDAPTRNKSLVWDLLGLTGNVTSPASSTAAISYKQGVPAAGAITSATEPSTTSGYIKIARINLDNNGGALAAVSQDMIADLRPLLFAGNLMHTGMRLAFPGKAAGLGTGLVGMRQKCPGVWITAGAQEGIAPAGGVSYQIEVYLFGGDLAPGLTPADEAGIPTIFPFASPRVPRMVLSPAYDLVGAAVQSKLAGTTVGWTNYGGTASVAIGQPYLSFTFELIHPSGSALNNTEHVWLSLMMGST
jgi:hypothetical protein